MHYNKVTKECALCGLKMMPYVRGCNGKNFKTNMEFLVEKVTNELKAEALECDKMDNMFALAITTANSTSCFFTRLHKMLKALREKEDNPENKRLLYKDMESVAEMQRGIDMIQKKLSTLYKFMDVKLEEIDQLYRLYVEPQTTKLFTNKGKFDIRQADNHLNNSMYVCELLIKYTKACICNEGNYNTVFNMLDNLKNDYPYALTPKDAESFKLKGFNAS